MSDHDRLADYFARIETPDHRRTLSDGCEGCGHSAVFCRCTAWIADDNAPCCESCSHTSRR